MNYFIHHKLYPLLAKYKPTYWYVWTICIVAFFLIFWLYIVDFHIKKRLLFYEAKLVEIQKKEASLIKKKLSLNHLEEEKADALSNLYAKKNMTDTFWQKETELLNSFIQKHSLAIDIFTVTEQNNKDMYRKKVVSLTLQGPIQKIVSFLEEIQKTECFALDNLSLHTESAKNWKMNCSFFLQKNKKAKK